jgi:hypothetical protein
MDQFQFTTGKHELCKLPEEWKLLELLRQYKILLRLTFWNKPNLESAKKHAKKIILLSKKILNLDITEDDFKKLHLEILDVFVNKKSELKNSIVDSLMKYNLGPLSFDSCGIIFDIDDFKEVFVQSTSTKFSKDTIFGLINSKKLGWIGWALVYADKSIVVNSDYMWLTNFNHFKKESCLKDIYEKINKFKNERSSRSLKRWLFTSSFWFDEDLNKLMDSLDQITLYNLSSAPRVYYDDKYYD